MIRPYTDHDYDALAALWALCGIAARAGEDKEGISQIAKMNEGLLLVQTDGTGKIIASVYATFDGRRGWINHLCVHPDHRQEGLASNLLEVVEEKLQERGCPQINLLIFPDNPYNLESWYAKRGYQSRNLQFMAKALGGNQ